MLTFNVTGMSCAACSARVEKAVKKVDGVTFCTVSLLTNSMQVEGTATAKDIIKAVKKAGYGASLKEKEGIEEDKTVKVLKRRLILSIGFLIVLVYVSMGHNMWGFPLPQFIEDSKTLLGLIQLVLALSVIIIDRSFFINGIKSVLKGAPNMDTLIAMGSGVAFIYSIYALISVIIAENSGNIADAAVWMKELYFESSAMIPTLITVGKLLEAMAKGRTADAVKSLMKLAPKEATILVDGKEIRVDIAEVKVGDVVAVKPGESIPVDAEIIKGEASVNEAMLTGESLPVDKAEGDTISAGTINLTGYVVCRVTKTGEDTAISKIIKTVSEASASKAPIARLADKVSGIFVPAVILIAVVTLAVWLLSGRLFGFALARAISVLVISCPCALGLATPVAIMVGNGVGAKKGILFKTAESLEETGKAQIAVLDKTGTLTNGDPEVTDIIAKDEKSLLTLAASLEAKSEHPIAKAIIRYAEKYGIAITETENFAVFAGNGLKANFGGKTVVGGNRGFVSEMADIDKALSEKASELALEGKTPVFFALDNKVIGVIAVADTLRPDSKEAVEVLHGLGIKVIMLTGDNKKTADTIGALCGVDEVIAEVKPEEKAEKVALLQKHGKVIMVGDGINDAPALTKADIGIAIGRGTDVAIDAADVVLVKNSLADVALAIKLSRKTLKNIKENLFWAFFYNAICIPLAAGVYIGLFGWSLDPMIGAAAMSLSSFTVVMNALRLNRAKL